MTRDERIKLLRNAAAMAAKNPLVPAAYRVALCALVDEVVYLGSRVSELERPTEKKGNV